VRFQYSGKLSDDGWTRSATLIVAATISDAPDAVVPSRSA
jgi:hypothetical protein